MQSGIPLSRLLASEGRKQAWLAERARIDAGTLNRIVHGRVRPTEAQALAIAEALGRSVAELWPN